MLKFCSDVLFVSVSARFGSTCTETVHLSDIGVDGKGCELGQRRKVEA